jgi:hypothetical protein
VQQRKGRVRHYSGHVYDEVRQIVVGPAQPKPQVRQLQSGSGLTHLRSRLRCILSTQQRNLKRSASRDELSTAHLQLVFSLSQQRNRQKESIIAYIVINWLQR